MKGEQKMTCKWNVIPQNSRKQNKYLLFCSIGKHSEKIEFLIIR